MRAASAGVVVGGEAAAIVVREVRQVSGDKFINDHLGYSNMWPATMHQTSVIFKDLILQNWKLS